MTNNYAKNHIYARCVNFFSVYGTRFEWQSRMGTKYQKDWRKHGALPPYESVGLSKENWFNFVDWVTWEPLVDFHYSLPACLHWPLPFVLDSDQLYLYQSLREGLRYIIPLYFTTSLCFKGWIPIQPTALKTHSFQNMLHDN